MANGGFEMVEMRLGRHHMNDRNRRYLVIPMGRDEGRFSTPIRRSASGQQQSSPSPETNDHSG
jgi:hypothetical protein